MDVSVVIPVFNRRRQVRAAVDSVCAQRGAAFELIVVDDGSEEDHSELEAVVTASGHRYYRRPHLGVAAARNFGASVSSGRYLAFLDSDDRWLPEKLASQLAFLREQPQFRVCQCQEAWFRRGIRLHPKAYHQMPHGDAFSASLRRCIISPSSVMLERSLFERLGGFDEWLRVCEDYELWLRLSACEHVGLVGRELVEKFGGHSDQLSRSEPVMDRFRV
ncbi:MAG: glycosyltransferase, partial [Bdellovibrionales bacterium]|nr:glycosyltransferase [Bdellovibrionales bacterium]